MTVKFYLGKGLMNDQQPLTWAHENAAVRKICQAVYDRLQQSETLYAVIAGPCVVGIGRELTPDMVVISELGMGIIELKEWAGSIEWGSSNQPNDPWRSHSTSPFKQVNEYAEIIYKDLTYPSAPDRHWLPALNEKEKLAFEAGRCWLKIFTTACFTHRNSQIRPAQQRSYLPYLANWGDFRVTVPSDIPDWTIDLRFEFDWAPAEKVDAKGHPLYIGQAVGYQPLKLFPAEVERLAEEYFHAVEWTDMRSYVQQGRAPYAYFKIVGDDEAPFLRIDREELRLGRSAKFSTLVIPPQYTYVSRKHIRLLYEKRQIFIEDLGSRHGTFLSDGRRVTQLTPLYPHQRIFLGGPEPSSKVCELELIPLEGAPNDPTASSTFMTDPTI